MFVYLNNLYYIDLTCEVVHLAMLLIGMNSYWRRPTYQGILLSLLQSLPIYASKSSFTTWIHAPNQPNTMDNMHIHQLSSRSWTMILSSSQVRIKVFKIICGDGMWHIDQWPSKFWIAMFCITSKYRCQVHNKDQYTKNDNWDSNFMLL